MTERDMPRALLYFLVTLSSSLARRHGRRRASFAALPAAPAAPLPKNLASLRFSGALIFEPRSRIGLLRSPSSVISTEQREWRNLARKRTCYKFFCRVRNNFCVLRKIPRLTLGMTKMVFFQRSFDSLRSLRMTREGAGPLFRRLLLAFPLGGRQGAAARRPYVRTRALRRAG